MNIVTASQEHRHALRDLQGHLAIAGDGKLREIVALVDSLPERGAADTLIAPLRARLTQLRPPRRLNLNRFLFLPADPVIVPAAAWRRGGLAIPRSALACLMKVIRTEFGADAESFTQAVDGVMSDNHAQIVTLGRMIWPRAAAFLAQTHVPPEWPGMTGLSGQDFFTIARPLAVLLGEAVAIEQMLPLAGHLDELAPPLRACITRALTTVAQMPAPENTTYSGRCLSIMLAVLLARMPEAEALLIATGDFAARQGDPITRLAADSAVDAMLDQAEARLAQPGHAVSICDLTRAATLIRALEEPGPACRPSRKSRAAALRRSLDAYCRERFQDDLANRLLRHVPQLDAATPDEMIADLEAAALELRRLEGVGRVLGMAAHYEPALAAAGQALLKLADPDMRRVDLARLMEILQGPEAGLAVLDGMSG